MAAKNEDGRMVLLRGTLYFSVALLTPIATVYAECARYHYWPDGPEVMNAVLAGLVAAMVALGSFIDGSAERFGQARREGGDGNVDQP